LVPGAGLEPARHCCREILSLLCLPISPPGLRGSGVRASNDTKAYEQRLLGSASALKAFAVY
jgi:hypothetical protein